MINLITSAITGIFKPAAELIDNLHTSEEEKLTLKNELTKVESSLISRVLETQESMMQNQAQTIIAETKSDSWLSRSWRPIIMLMFGIMIGVDSVTSIPFELDQYGYEVLYLGIGGYIGGRSVEKVAKTVTVFKTHQ